MKVLLIGGNGFVGSAVARFLLHRGHSVSSLSRGNSRPPAEVEPLTADRKDAASFATAVGKRSFDLVVDLTAFQGADIDAVIPALRGRVGHYVMISTDFVYATDLEQLPINEDARKDEHSPYATGKLACEAKLLELHRLEQFPCTILRPGHILGAGRALGTTSVEGRDPKLLRRLRSGAGPTLIENGQLLIQPVWHRQIAAAVCAVHGKPQTHGRSFNVANEHAVTVRLYYQMICDLLGVPLRFGSVPLVQYREQNPGKLAFARHRVYDLSHLKAAADFHPGSHLPEAIAESVAWMERME